MGYYIHIQFNVVLKITLNHFIMKNFTLIIMFLFSTLLVAQNQLLSSIDEYYDTASSQWINSSGNNYAYDSNGNLTSEEYLFWDTSTSLWQQSYQTIYSYNANSLATMVLEQNYNSTTSQYEDSYRITYSYNSSNQLISQVFEEYVGSAWVPSDRFTVTYTNGVLTTAIIEVWNGSQYDPEERFTLSYSGSNITQFLIEYWVSSQWVLGERDLINYNGSNQRTNRIYEEWDGTTWSETDRETYTLDTFGNRISTLSTFIGNPSQDYKIDLIFDTSIQLSTLDHPFKDKTGIDFIYDESPYISKVLTSTESQYDSAVMIFSANYRTTFNYNSTLSNSDIALETLPFKVYPNPTSEFVFIEGAELIHTVELYDMMGRKVMDSTNERISIHHLPTGLYNLIIEDINGLKSDFKIIKD